MSHQTDHNRQPWSASQTAAMVGADPARQVEHTVEGPTLHERENGFGRGLASVDSSPTCFGRSSRASARLLGSGRPSTRFVRGALLAIACALLAAGCGGGEDPAAAVDPALTATPPVDDGTGVVAGNTGTGDPAVDGGNVGGIGGGAEAAEEIPGLNEIATANAASGSAVAISAITPKKFAKAHCSKPIMVVYYQPKSVVDTKMLAQAKQAFKTSKDAVLLMYTPKDVKAAGDLPAKLGLFSTPGVAIVNRAGEIENFWVSYVDHALLQFSLQNASNAKPCKVSTEDVPAPGSALADAALVAGGGTVAGTTTSSEDGTPPNTPAIDAAGAVDPVTGQPAAGTPIS